MSWYEKKALIRFLGIYVGSTMLLFGIIAYLFVGQEQDRLLDHQRLKMQSHAAKIINEARNAQAFGYATIHIPKNSEFRVGLYDASGHPIYSEITEPIFFERDFFMQDEKLYFVESSSQLGWGVHYIAVEESGFIQKIKNLRFFTAFALALVTIFISFVAFWLSKLFIEPLKEEMERRNKFIQDTTHDLATPISALLLGLKSLKSDEPQKIKRVTAAARAISDSYQNLTHLFMKDIELRVDNHIDFEQFVIDRVAWFADLAAVKRVKITTHLEPFEFKMDLNLATRMVDNLLQNAIKYSKHDGEVIVILAKNRLLIKDSGVGIAEADQKRIFHRYQRSETNRGGFGIGLDIVVRICRMYKIELKLKSELGVGSEFLLLFPQVD